jgi:hypothetical protein
MNPPLVILAAMTIIGLGSNGGAEGGCHSKATAVVCPHGAPEEGLVHQSQFKEVLHSVYLNNHVSRGFCRHRLTEHHQ